MTEKNPLDELKELILGIEKRQLEELAATVNDPVKFARAIRKILPSVYNIGLDNDEELSSSLIPYVEKALHYSIRNNPEPVSEVLFPVIGPAIRKAVADAFNKILENVNTALENSFSLKRLKWRMEALFTKKTFAEILMYHNPAFRVNHLFLIHRQTGLLLRDVVNAGVNEQDSDIISSMLKAIQDFVHDSLDPLKEQELEAIRVGTLNIYVEQGPFAILAAVVEGNPTEPYREKLKKTIEKIHADYYDFLSNFSGNPDVFRSTSTLLNRCMEHFAPKPKKKPVRSIIMFAFVLLAILLLTVFRIYESSRYRSFFKQLSGVPGMEITNVYKQKGIYHVNGLMDRDAADPYALTDSFGLDRNKVRFQMDPYQSLETEIVMKRVCRITKPAPGVSLNLSIDTLIISGELNENWVADVKKTAFLIPGISHLQFKQDSNAILIMQHLVDKIESTEFEFRIGQSTFSAGNRRLLDSLYINCNELNRLAAIYDKKIKYMLLGFADMLGVSNANQALSLARASNVARFLIDRGIPREQVFPVAMGSEKYPYFDVSHSNRMVLVRINMKSL